MSRARFQRAREEALGTVIPWARERPRQMVELQAAWIGLSGALAPGVLDDVDAARIGRDTPALVEWAEVIDRATSAGRSFPGRPLPWSGYGSVRRVAAGDALARRCHTDGLGRDHLPDLPTEVFTSPDPERTEGMSGHPASGLRIRSERGRAVQIDTDEGLSC